MDGLDRFTITVYLHPYKTRRQKLLKKGIYVHLRNAAFTNDPAPRGVTGLYCKLGWHI